MKFSVVKGELSRLLYLSSNIVERRTTMPILANVKLSADGNNVSVAATDLEVSFLGEVKGEVKSPGSVTLSGKMLHDIVRELPGETLQFNLAPSCRVEIQAGSSKFKVNGVSADEFPSIAGVGLTSPAAIDAQLFHEMIEKTAFATATDQTRYNINGICIENVPGSKKGEGMLRVVATDGHRLAMIDRQVNGFDVAKSVIIPRKGIQELKKVLEGNSGAAHVGIHDGFLTVRSEGVTLGIRLVDGQFPDYHQIVPTENRTTVRANRAEFLSAVRRVSLVSSDRSRTVKLVFSNGEVLISSASPEYGEASESSPVAIEGEAVSVGFSAVYLFDLMNAMTTAEEIVMRFSGEIGPGVFQGDNDESYTCVVMPMRFE